MIEPLIDTLENEDKLAEQDDMAVNVDTLLEDNQDNQGNQDNQDNQGNQDNQDNQGNQDNQEERSQYKKLL